jgi:peptide chain release factor subunit 1
MRTARPGIDRTTLHSLATRRGEPAVTSVYLDVDGAHRPVAAVYEQAFERLADELRRRARVQGRDELVVSVERDLDTMRAWLGGGIDRTTTRGLAMFSCGEQDWFEARELPVRVRDEVGFGPAPRIRQLAELLDEPEPFVLALVDATHLRLFRIDGRDIEERPTLITHQERSVDTSIELGSFEHHQEEAARIHLRRAAAEVDDEMHRRPARQLVIGGPEPAVSALEDDLHATTRALIVGRVEVRVAAPVEEIASRARAVAEKAERQREAALVEEVRQRTAGDHGGVVGLEATLEALAARRVETLLVRDGFVAPGGSCPACGHLGPDLRLCPVCGTRNEGIDDVIEIAIEQAVAQSAEVEFCRGTELERFGGIAAIERY